MDEYPNWFISDGLRNFETHLLPLKGLPIRVLQIGAYTGDASVWLAENILTHQDSILVDVDTWEGSDEPSHKQMSWQTVESLYDFKTMSFRENRKILKYKGTSDSFFRNNVELYDFVYVDGDHTSYGVIKDAVASFEVLKPEGIIAFDDYMWSAGLGAHKEPKMAIDAFETIYKDKVELLLKDYQCWFRKNL